MATVRLEISATPAHVRTARLVATAVARRSGVDDAALDEIRLAVGEACSRAVGLHRDHAPAELVSLIMEDEGRFTVTVVDMAPVGAEAADVDPLDLVDGVEGALLPIPEGAADLLPTGFGLAVIGGLVDDLVISPAKEGPGTRVQMSWPLRSGRRR
jgi:anti-sigma regulatory factor (Ser/Thr protein kinase)